MTIKKIWFDGEWLYGLDDKGKTFRQSLLWYPRLNGAADEQRARYEFGLDGIHWRELDEDVSFESFGYEDAEPTKFQRAFLSNKRVNIAEIAQMAGISKSLLHSYINGFKKPSADREQLILDALNTELKCVPARNV